MDIWAEVGRELDEWSSQGRRATLWWRDDDAIAGTPALERLLSTGAAADLAVFLAVIPGPADESLADRIRGLPGVPVLQHGFDHANHAPAGEKRAEFGAGRPFPQALDELARGRQLLSELLPGQLRPVLVPPWNRIDSGLLTRLTDLGFEAVSTFGPRRARRPAPGLHQTNTHIDIVDWRGTRGFIGAGAALGQALDHLSARRLGTIDPAEPTGLLTHHLSHDEACWDFLAELFERLGRHPGAVWLGAEEVF